MKLRAAAWAGTLCLILLAASCSRSTPANTTSSQAQPTPDQTPQQSATPAADEAKTPEKSNPAPVLKKHTTKPEARADTAQNVPPAPPPPPVILPAGTVLTVRINDAVSAKTSKPGDKFTASTTQPVALQGRTVIPAGSSVMGTVDAAKQGGKISGESSLSLRLTAVLVQGTSYPISTGPFVQQAKGKGSRTAKIGAGSAAAGALIGGLSGGGKGALIGSAVGAGAGVAGSAFTGNKELNIPAESILQFPLAQPLRLQTAGNNSQQPAPNQEEK